MKIRIIVSVLFFALLVVLDQLQYSGPLNAEVRNAVIILLGFLVPALLIGNQPLRSKILISLTCSVVAGIVWNFWSNFLNSAAWDLRSILFIFPFAIVAFGIALVFNELVVYLISKKVVR